MIESGAKSNRAVKQLTFSSPLPYFRSVHLSICCSVWPVHPHVHQYVHLSINLSIGLSVHLMVSLSTCSTRMAGKSCIYCQTTIHHIQFFSPTPPPMLMLNQSLCRQHGTQIKIYGMLSWNVTSARHQSKITESSMHSLKDKSIGLQGIFLWAWLKLEEPYCNFYYFFPLLYISRIA